MYVCIPSCLDLETTVKNWEIKQNLSANYLGELSLAISQTEDSSIFRNSNPILLV